ncbi:MAG: VOC family protein [Mariniphaga sp.]|nr:VOC family protein [Mariniphaga sp.]
MKTLFILFIAIMMLTASAQAQEKFGKGNVTQIGLVVKDIEKASEKWAAILGFSEIPQLITDGFEKANTHFKGKPTDARAKLAFFRLENITIELIEPVGKKSTWYEHLKKHGEGFHHIAFNVEGMEEKIVYLENRGGKLLQKGDFTGGSYSYVDMSELGIIFELLTSTGN